jgi:transposase
MSTKRTHYRQTTPDQRRLLFETWEATGSVTEASQVAHVCRQTFYVWEPRFTAEGYAGLLEFASRAPKHPSRIDASIESRVIALRQEHPSWGKQRIADELTQANQWVPLVSRGTVRRILIDVGLWPEPAAAVKKKRR